MGKALVFDGVVVTSPLQTITITTPDSDAERIANYFELGSAQFAALNGLIKSLKTSGAWDKMKYLMLPILATSVEEAAQNVLLTNDRVPNTTNLTFENGKLLSASEGLVLADYVQGTGTFNPCTFGWYLDTGGYPFQEGKYSQAAILVGSNRLARGRSNTSSTVDLWSVNVNRLSGGTSSPQTVSDLSEFSAFSLYEESGDLKADKIVGDDETATTSTVASNSTYGNNFSNSGLQLSTNSMSSNYGVTYNGGYKIFWMSEILTTSQLESAHKAFKAFIDVLENIS